jgi:penicillin-binding protein 1A
MQQVGPLRVAQLARAMGVRESKLDVVPSLALGTSPVTLKEMVAAYGAIASGGSYRAPRVITRIDDKNGKVLEDFAPAAPERVLGLAAAQQLRDAMRGVVDKGTGVAIRSRWGINADVAGKTGTTQDNTDGWFILMHPQLVAGAWVGFNDGRITLRSDYWGQGAHSALPMVGEVFQQALRAKVIGARERFIDEEEISWVGSAVAGVRNWVYDLFGRRTGGPDGPDTAPAPPPPAAAEQPEITEAPLVPLENATPQAPPFAPGNYGNVPEAPYAAPAPQPGIVLDMPVDPGVVVPVPVQGNPPFFVETRP